MSAQVNFRDSTSTHLAFSMTSEVNLAQKCPTGCSTLVLISHFCMTLDKCIALRDFQHHIIYQFFHLIVKH